MIQIVLLRPEDASLLGQVAPEVFDNRIRPELADEFLADPRHHLAVAVEAEVVVGFASAVHYVHPDKSPELWINEVGVSPAHQRQGLAKRLMQALFETGRSLGCRNAWVLTESSNHPARRLYAALGGVEPATETVMIEFAIGVGGAPLEFPRENRAS